MASMNISLPDELKQFIDAQVAEHAYGSSSEYLPELTRKQRDVEKLGGMLFGEFNSGQRKWPTTGTLPDCGIVQMAHPNRDRQACHLGSAGDA
ncbi:MAG: hypothetical protein ABI268_05065 [Rhodanobacter sp.]